MLHNTDFRSIGIFHQLSSIFKMSIIHVRLLMYRNIFSLLNFGICPFSWVCHILLRKLVQLRVLICVLRWCLYVLFSLNIISPSKKIIIKADNNEDQYFFLAFPLFSLSNFSTDNNYWWGQKEQPTKIDRLSK